MHAGAGIAIHVYIIMHNYIMIMLWEIFLGRGRVLSSYAGHAAVSNYSTPAKVFLICLYL